MDVWGIVIFLIGGALYLWKKKPLFLFLSGIGGGIVVGAIWATAIFYSILP